MTALRCIIQVQIWWGQYKFVHFLASTHLADLNRNPRALQQMVWDVGILPKVSVALKSRRVWIRLIAAPIKDVAEENTFNRMGEE